METEKTGNKGLLWYIENNKTVIEPPLSLTTHTFKEVWDDLMKGMYPPTPPKIPKRVPKCKK
jgi:hypothetical protein